MYCKICDKHYPPFKLVLFHKGEAVEAYVCPEGHTTGRCKRFVFIQQVGKVSAVFQQPCATCSDRFFCTTEFRYS